MKFRTLKRHFREGIKNIFRNGWMTVASIGAVTTTLILVGVFLALMLNLNKMADNIEDDVEINVLIDLTAKEDQIKQLGDNIEKMDEVDKVEFSSKDEQLEGLVKSMGKEGDSWQLFEQDNPLNHVFIVKTKDPLDTIDVANDIADFDNVQEVNYGKDVVNRLFQFNQYARNIGLVLIAGLVFTAIFLISNTIKLTIMARSKEIGIMKLVGATNGFIRWPFFVEGMLLGIFGSIIPIAAILGGYYYLENNLSERFNLKFSFVELLPFNPFAWQLSLIILVIGGLIGIWGSVMSVRKFLKV
ncbi:FtsX-like permease family protein [Virgibacillus dakarensis]|uniref:Cell division protein FtsX n=1 Tax=Lentibacillus populi TaxID=1827502 RepID=A0A9W5U0J1_9BACI|nr:MULTISPECIES: permease-like cell division protein FtsX [Bacillaceae]MBT2216114.1 permease-like cell division protein FtsX [Virgibacillus dakarensis]MTW86370.1 FtsX-like permease family protein [Virgibacillus dakarensis]GGB53754.1 cell division protein FtsX [Lentibacillus populi]